MWQFDGEPDVGGDYIYPRGWFIVGTSDEITREPVTLQFLGKKFVAYRGEDSGVIIMDGICPHMGADLGVGGIANGDSIRCPFHDWSFGPNGKCNHIPYANKIPPKAKLEAYNVQEQNGLVFMWHDPAMGEPDFTVPYQAEYDDPHWTKWEPETIVIKTHQREIIDNISDKGHFDPVHFSTVKSFENNFEGHNATQHMVGGHKTLAESGQLLDSFATYHGPGYLLTTLTGTYDSIMLVAHTPIDTQNVRVWYGLMVNVGDNSLPKAQEAATAYKNAGRHAFFQDVAIWENKATINQPLLCDGDGPIMKAREWYSQFYRPLEDQPAQVAAE